MKNWIRGTAVAGALLALPLAAQAQEETKDEAAPEQEVCVAVVTPVEAGTITPVTATFTSAFGEVLIVKAPEDSGILLASDEAVAQVEMAAEENDEELVELSDDAATTIFWLDTRNASAGTYALVLENEGGSCKTEIVVEGPAN